MVDKLTINGKITFILGFLALILALSPFKDLLDGISINFFGYTISLTFFILIMSLILFTSIYFYLIDSIKYSYSKLATWKLFNYVSKFGDMLYIMAILLPLLTIIFWGLISLILLISPIFKQYNYILSIFAGIISALIGYLFGGKINKEQKEKQIEKASEEEESSIIKAKKAFNDKYYEYMLIELNNSLLNLLYRRLAKKLDFGKNAFANNELIELAYKQKIIDSSERALLHDIRVLRNSAAHGRLERPISKESAEQLLKNTEKLLKRLG